MELKPTVLKRCFYCEYWKAASKPMNDKIPVPWGVCNLPQQGISKSPMLLVSEGLSVELYTRNDHSCGGFVQLQPTAQVRSTRNSINSTRTAEQVYSEFSEDDKRWPVCICGHIAQQHPHSSGDACVCREYRPRTALTPLQAELEQIRKLEHPQQKLSSSQVLLNEINGNR